MFSSDRDPHLGKSQTIKIRVVSLEGRELLIDVSNDSKIETIKVVSVSQLYKSEEPSAFQLIMLRMQKSLDDDSTVQKYGLHSKDELLLVRRPVTPPSSRCLEDTLTDRPDYEEILAATADMEVKPSDFYGGASGIGISGESQRLDAVTVGSKRWTPILVSLIEASQRILCLNKNAAKIMQQVQEQLSDPRDLYPEADESSVRQLADMGFPRSRVIKAVRLHNNLVMDAMDWLLGHQDDPAADEPLVATRNCAPLLQGEGEPRRSQDRAGQEFIEPMSPRRILALHRAYNRRQFRPNEAAKSHLMEMGFEEGSSVDALRLSSNDESQALEQLLAGMGSNAGGVGTSANRGPELTGLSPDCPLWRAIMADPTIQLALTNPNALFALLSMLDNPATWLQWCNHPEVGALFTRVHALLSYHHSSNTNQDAGAADVMPGLPEDQLVVASESADGDMSGLGELLI